jgi:uncharacterized protein DUF6879
VSQGISRSVDRPTLNELIAGAIASAVHLELRDIYTPSDPVFHRWKAGESVEELVPAWSEWFDLVRSRAMRGVRFRRARVFSTPPTDFLRYEHDLTPGLNLAAGEDVRWLPRSRASDLALPGNDFWLLDDQLVVFNIFDGEGEPLTDGDDEQITNDPAVVELCRSAFEAVWSRATPHREYRM